VIRKVGADIGRRVVDMRRRAREINATISGSALSPVCGLPGGVSRALSEEDRERIRDVADDAVEFARFTLKTFDDLVLENTQYLELITGDVYYHQTYYMGLVDDDNRVNFYDGTLRVVDPEGNEFARFHPRDYLDHLEEVPVPWSYMRLLYLKSIGWA